jgi:hypothetical protein
MSKDEQLEERHNQYIQMVTESGLPLWMADLYGGFEHIPDGVFNDNDIDVSKLPSFSQGDKTNPKK